MLCNAMQWSRSRRRHLGKKQARCLVHRQVHHCRRCRWDNFVAAVIAREPSNTPTQPGMLWCDASAVVPHATCTPACRRSRASLQTCRAACASACPARILQTAEQKRARPGRFVEVRNASSTHGLTGATASSRTRQCVSSVMSKNAHSGVSRHAREHSFVVKCARTCQAIVTEQSCSRTLPGCNHTSSA